MIRMAIVVEGHSENSFFTRYLEELFPYNFGEKDSLLKCNIDIINLKGMGDIDILKKKIINQLIGFDIVTTFVDYYGIKNIKKGYNKNNKFKNFFDEFIDFNNFDSILIPYVQMHEFETLLLSDVDKLTNILQNNNVKVSNVAGTLKSDIKNYNDIEEINGSQDTSPSKRIIKYYPDYENMKLNIPNLVIKSIGIDVIRTKCKFFNIWIEKMNYIINHYEELKNTHKLINIFEI